MHCMKENSNLPSLQECLVCAQGGGGEENQGHTSPAAELF